MHYEIALELEKQGEFLVSIKHFFAASELGHKAFIQRCVNFTKIEKISSKELAIQKDVDPENLFYLGLQVLLGLGRPVCADLAYTYFEAASQGGCQGAQWILGVWYEFGLGGQVDYCKAEDWYRSAARHGHVLAQVSLGGCLSKARGFCRITLKCCIGIVWQQNKVMLRLKIIWV